MYSEELSLKHYGFSEADLNKEFTLGPGILPRFATKEKQRMSLKQIIENCERLYCGSYGVEYVHIPDRAKCDWLRERLEIPIPYKYDVEQPVHSLCEHLFLSSSSL